MKYTDFLDHLQSSRTTWLVTGAAGFIGSNLVETLLKHGQKVRGLDNFSTGKKPNLELVRSSCGDELWKNFDFIEGDIRDMRDVKEAVTGAQVVLHQAAMGSVPRSLEDPVTTNACNIDGFLNMLVASRDAGVRRFVYAASSSTYGDEPTLPKVENRIGNPLSPYAVTKLVNELYASVFSLSYGFKSIGLRYFNIFGKMQDPHGAYAAVIPLWFSALLKGGDVYINGDGETSRDFCYIENCVQANLRAGMADSDDALDQVYNVAYGQRTTLNRLFELLRDEAARFRPEAAASKPIYRDFRAGDVRHSLADISKARKLLDYEPEYDITRGITLASQWYAKHL